MSQPNLPNITPVVTLSRDDTINLLLSSIAMEELGMAHILNAEGEKIQYALGTIPGLTGPPSSLADILNLNESVRDTLDSLMKQELLLGSKLDSISNIPTLAGPQDLREQSARPERRGQPDRPGRRGSPVRVFKGLLLLIR
ncbi:hypothetical protein [Bacillus velezensis]|uniref:hypothetical protein n=1 Tax=Bacillus velezensis TaxID=492670 RepID=UPI001F44BED3|nr:hypothetical protein [Bacillus velezensis]